MSRSEEVRKGGGREGGEGRIEGERYAMITGNRWELGEGGAA